MIVLVCGQRSHNPYLRVKRQEPEPIKKEESFEVELCKDKDAGEWFRLVAGDGDNCRDVIQCTSSDGSLACGDGNCIERGLFCNGEKDCSDGSDENTCELTKQGVVGLAPATTSTAIRPLSIHRLLSPSLFSLHSKNLFSIPSPPRRTFNHIWTKARVEANNFRSTKIKSSSKSVFTILDLEISGSQTRVRAAQGECPRLSGDNDNDPNRAPPCDPAVCVLPDCFCSEDGTTIPGDLPAKDVPQMITITFDDAINNNNIELYKEMFNGKRKNPNGCDIKATFFVSHKYSNYSAVQETHRKGHEIAVHSITKGHETASHLTTHNDDEQFWSNATVDDWAKEMAGTRIIVEKFANISDNSVVGVRAPYLRVGGNNQFTMMEEQAFLYDSTITAPLSNPPLWPYTMYFRMPHRCHGNLQHCPTRSHAVWEMVMNELDRREDPQFDEYLPGCAMVDSCSNILSGDQFYNFLNHNFDRHYEKNRAPLGLYFHAAWLKNNPEYLDAFLYWIDEILANHNDVYFVTMTQVIQWIQNPRTVTEVKNFEPWREKCSVEGKPSCWVPHSCKLTSKEIPGETINLQTCVRCPNNYPWLNDPTGDGFF
ncbi:unnamed protein product [Timema podura]|uniref:NodB homology domain-containing protein n=1 Tax=Timema podura TaxID=61482 RepID=A0ABN7NDM4_TIMPD|nr:unnamed protein product [Timema podura]